MSEPFPLTPLGEVLIPVERPVEPIPGKVYRQIGVQLWGQGAYEREAIDGVATRYRTFTKVEAGDIIVNKIWARSGSVAVVTDALAGCYCSSEFPIFVARRDWLNPKWFHWITKTKWFWNACDVKSRGTSGKNRIRPEKFLEIEIPFPPLDDQWQIVARIEELAAKIEEAKGLRKQAVGEGDVVIASYLSKLFSKGAMHGWRNGVLGDYVVDCTYGTSVKTNDDSSGIPILRMGNIQSGQLDTRNVKYLYLSDSETEKLMLQKGDILVNRTKSAELVGKCAVFHLEGDYSFASYLIRLRLDLTRAEPNLVAAYINSPAGRAYMFSERKQMTGQANVNSKKLRALPISLPPLDEQRRIVAHLDALQSKVDALKRLQEETQKELDALLPSILDKAFKGELV